MNLFTKLTAATLCTGALALASSADAITLKHDEGVTQIEGIPQRVVVLDEESLGMMYALGLGDKVVGVGGPRLSLVALQEGNVIPSEIRNTGFMAEGKLNSTAQYVGSWTAPNLETITALKPDLIIRLTWNGNEKNYGQLSKIAPTISYKENAPGYYQRWLRDLGRVFNKSLMAESVLRKVKSTQTNARIQLNSADVLDKYPKVLVLSLYNSGAIYAYNRVRVIDDLKALGFKNAYTKDAEDKNQKSEKISREYLLTVTPDTLVVLMPSSSNPELAEEFLNSPVGSRLKDQAIAYDWKKYSPWTGPLVSIRTIKDLTTQVIEMVK